MATFVLIHGSWGGAWIWQKVTPLLRAAGHEVYTSGLTGLSDRSHLLNCGVDLTTHITDVASLLFHEDLSDVVLVGNSHAGMVITGVAAHVPERLRQLVYLDAYVPDDGQSEVDLWPNEMRAAIEADEAAGRGLRPPASPEWLGITDPDMANWVKARMTPQPLATYTQPVPRGNAQSAALPRVYLHCTAGPTTALFAPFAAKARAAGWRVYEFATGHVAMLTAPSELAAFLLDVANTHA
ncbi:MAG: alpha/beta fold hydrolase [Chloroflexi bacterium]|nr:alpha/beta fold hydrolase [Chloroflexota bacterium]